MKQTTARNYFVNSALVEEEYREEGYDVLYGILTVLDNGMESLQLVDPDLVGEESDDGVFGEILGQPGTFVPAKKFKAVDVYMGRGDKSIELIEEYIHESAEVVAKLVHDYDKAVMEEEYKGAAEWVVKKELEFYHMEERYGMWFVQTGEEREYIILPEDHEWFNKVEAIKDGSASEEDYAAWDNFVENMWT